MLEAYKAGGVGNFPGASGAFFVVVRKTWCRPFFSVALNPFPAGSAAWK